MSLDQSLVCLPAYADSSCLDKITGEKIIAALLRVTCILQEYEGQWLCGTATGHCPALMLFENRRYLPSEQISNISP
ncbi:MULTISPECIES: hypothetical protein [unclassified Endozoicomonas]|uniref:hypothetical protein n=1 Tax=unclassified Endozoicomonas TaxID=2644528 RepID=UPI003BB79848